MKPFYYTNQTVDRHKARKVELYIEAATGLPLENPFYDGDAKEVKHLDAGKTTTITADEIVGMDLRKIREAQGIVAYMTNWHNIGSCMEIAICAYAWGKPVYVIAPNKGIYAHPWIEYFATKRFHTAKEFVKWYNTEMRK